MAPSEISNSGSSSNLPNAETTAKQIESACKADFGDKTGHALLDQANLIAKELQNVPKATADKFLTQVNTDLKNQGFPNISVCDSNAEQKLQFEQDDSNGQGLPGQPIPKALDKTAVLIDATNSANPDKVTKAGFAESSGGYQIPEQEEISAIIPFPDNATGSSSALPSSDVSVRWPVRGT